MKPDISVKWASKHIDCTSKVRKVCKGDCCYYSNGHGRYTKEEYIKLPHSLQRRLIYKDGEFYCKDINGACDFLEICQKKPQLKPNQCKLYPFIFNSKDRLVLTHSIRWRCTNYNKGDKSIFENLQAELIDVFGKVWYEKKLKEIKNENLRK